MALGTSIALIAIGAILKFAVSFSITGIDINIVGLILMIVGVLGLAISLVMMIVGGPRPGDHRDPRDAPTRRF
jgi:hypothetical protein